MYTGGCQEILWCSGEISAGVPESHNFETAVRPDSYTCTPTTYCEFLLFNFIILTLIYL
jgi:hypothetical protein